MINKRKYIRYVTDEKLEQINPANRMLIEMYFNSKRTLSDTSRRAYENDFNQWLVYIMENYDNDYILDFDTEDAANMIDDFIAFCTTVLGNNERRIQRRLSSISSFYLFLRKKRRIKLRKYRTEPIEVRENPVDFIERPRVGKKDKLQIKQTFLTEEQVNDIRKGLKEIGDIQLTLFFEFGLSTMARANAISNIRIEQIDFKKNRVVDVLEKEGKIVTLFPSRLAIDLIKKWLDYRKENGIESEYLFITKYRGKWDKVHKSTLQNVWIKKIGDIIGIPELHCHDLRHSGANIYYHRGMSLENVQILLNHESPQTTQDHYLQTNFDAVQDEKSKFEI